MILIMVLFILPSDSIPYYLVSTQVKEETVEFKKDRSNHFTDAADKWTYNDPGEKSWSELCRTGSRQSPIDIRTSQVSYDQSGFFIRRPLSFSLYDDVLVSGENTGRTIKFSVLDSNQELPQLKGGPLTAVYVLDSFHFHWFSEHTINGERFPMEIHLVHRRIDLEMEQCMNKSDGLAVVGVFVKNAVEADALNEIVKDLQNLSTVNSKTVSRQINLWRLLSPQLNSFYTYSGSLTTPDCQEVVTWIIQKQPIGISNDQFKLFREADVGTELTFRALKPINSRTILATKDKYLQTIE